MNLLHTNYIVASGNGPTFNIDIEPRTGADSLNYFQASCQAAEMVADSRQGQLFLMYSGGVDSEYTLSVFRHLGIPITPIIVRLLPAYNTHDIAYATKYCNSHGIRPLFLDIEFDRFVESGEMYTIARSMNCSKYHYAATARAIGSINGTVLCGDGEPYIRLDPETKRWNIMIHEYEYGLTNFYQLHNLSGTPHFNRYTKEMYYSFLLDVRMQELANNQVPGKTSSFSSKWIIYNRHSGFNLEERPKYHGYERVEMSPIFQHESFERLKQEMTPAMDGDWVMDYFTFIEQCVQ